MLETDGAGAILITYIYDDASTPLVIVQAANSPYNATAQEQAVYLHTGHLGTPRMATDSNRRIIWKWESDAFGSTVPQQDPDGDGKQTIVNLRFPGQYYDAESSLHQNWHRTYDPSLGRYISSDPIGLAGGVNTYGYVGQSPLNLIDPSGENALAVEATEGNKKGETCAQKYPSYINCSSLYGYNFNNWHEAFSVFGGGCSTHSDNSPAKRGLCRGNGKHWNIRVGNKRIGSITSCTCCQDSPNGAKLMTKYRVH